MSNEFQFVKAQKFGGKVRMSIAGPSGSGKTYTALSIAQALGGRVAVIDSERGTASKYADRFNFDVLALNPPYSVERYIAAINAAKGYDVLVIDSLSHAWAGPGGVLEYVDNRSAAYHGSTFGAWADGTKLQNKLVDNLLSVPGHLIVTMRSKVTYTPDKDEKGKPIIRKLGMQPIQRDGLEYEFDVKSSLLLPDHILVIEETRCPGLDGKMFERTDGKDVAEILLNWLSGEAVPEPVPWHKDPNKVAEFEKKAKMPLSEVLDRFGMTAPEQWKGTAQELLSGAVAKVPERVHWGTVDAIAKVVAMVLETPLDIAAAELGGLIEDYPGSPADFIREVRDNIA